MTDARVWPGAFRSGNTTLNTDFSEASTPDAPLLILVNSLGCDLRIWECVVTKLVGQLQVLRYDTRGHGLSDTGDTPYSIDTHTSDLIALIESFGDGAGAFVCGLSIGGLIAMAASIKRPELVRGLILCDTAARIGTAARYENRIERLIAGGIDAIADEQMQRWFPPAFRDNHPDVVRMMRNMLVRQPVDGYLGSVVALRDSDLSDRIEEISAPTLCLVGSEDASTPPKTVQALADGIAGARYSEIVGVGHLPCIEAPDAVADRILDFVQDFA